MLTPTGKKPAIFLLAWSNRLNRVAVFFEGKPLACLDKLSVFRSKAQAYLFLTDSIGAGWSRSHEVRTIWRRSDPTSQRSTSESDDTL